MGQKPKKAKTSVIYDNDERRNDILNRMKAGKTRKAEGKRRHEEKIKEEKRQMRRDKDAMRKEKIEGVRENYERIQRVVQAVHERKDLKVDETYTTEDNEKVNIKITYL